MSQAVLVVDDDYTVRTLLKRILSRAGFSVSEAADGLEALQKIRCGQYDLVTMDIAMDRIDGIDAISVLRSEMDAPIVVISAYLTDEVRTDLEMRDVQHVLDKPFGPDEVVSVVRQALERD